MRLETTVRDLLAATWYVPAERVERALPEGVRPALAEDGRALVTLVGLRNADVRLGGLRVPGFSQLGIRTYVTAGGDPAIFVLAVRVTAAGLGGSLFGVPVRPVRVGVRPGSVIAPGAGVRIRYRADGDARSLPLAGDTPVGEHDVALFVSAGLRRLVSRHDAFSWQEAELLERPLVEPVLALGFDVGEPDSLLYAQATRFSVSLPPERLA